MGQPRRDFRAVGSRQRPARALTHSLREREKERELTSVHTHTHKRERERLRERELTSVSPWDQWARDVRAVCAADGGGGRSGIAL